jgi:N-acyl homoserine lactone hydrolase
MSKLRLLRSFALPAYCLTLAAPLAACRPTNHAAVPSPIGIARPSSALEAVVDVPGPVVVETVIGADWEAARSGLINLDDPKAREAKLVDGPEPIVILLHAIRHPTAGLYVVDTGVERAQRNDPKHAAWSGFVANYMGVDKLRVRTDTASWTAAQKEPVKGVFLTHLHPDHVSGMRDVPNTAAVYTGAGESAERHLTNILVQPMVDAALEGKGDLREWRFTNDPDGAFDGVVDIFGDGTVWALQVPGHTDGSTAYLARTPNGPVLLTGDASHTIWGWDQGVEPGTFSSDVPRGRRSLEQLRAFVAKHPQIEVRVGHQVRSAADPRPSR